MRILFKNSRCIFLTLSLCILSFTINAAPSYYQIKVYYFKNKEQESRLNQYFEKAFVPAAHRAGITRVGIFKSFDEDTLRRFFVFVPVQSLSELEKFEQKLSADQLYIKEGSDFIQAGYKNSPYKRIETILLRAFPNMTEPALSGLTGNKADRFYELRSYESPTEKYYAQKVKMFNTGGEINIFKRLNFNAIFYADVIAGAHMPNLMYLTTFNNKADRDKHWKDFDGDSEWQVLKAKDEYQNTISGAELIFLHPTAYSDF